MRRERAGGRERESERERASEREREIEREREKERESARARESEAERERERERTPQRRCEGAECQTFAKVTAKATSFHFSATSPRTCGMPCCRSGVVSAADIGPGVLTPHALSAFSLLLLSPRPHHLSLGSCGGVVDRDVSLSTWAAAV